MRPHYPVVTSNQVSLHFSGSLSWKDASNPKPICSALILSSQLYRKVHTTPIQLLHQKLFNRHAMSIIRNQNIIGVDNHTSAPPGWDAMRYLNLFPRVWMDVKDSNAARLR
mmetsp:Transcript_31608/g.66463  ORF Transcript_31608/g.66463 Transcript_31608/m.66463 type:complete len:111 (-) Transcript_31608:1823-2155(-)